jgi:hypothetical protein
VGSPFRCVVGRVRRGRLRLVPAIAFVRHQDQNWERPLGKTTLASIRWASDCLRFGWT